MTKAPAASSVEPLRPDQLESASAESAARCERRLIINDWFSAPTFEGTISPGTVIGFEDYCSDCD